MGGTLGGTLGGIFLGRGVALPPILGRAHAIPRWGGTGYGVYFAQSGVGGYAYGLSTFGNRDLDSTYG